MVVPVTTWRAPVAVFQGLLDPPAPYEVSWSSVKINYLFTKNKKIIHLPIRKSFKNPKTKQNFILNILLYLVEFSDVETYTFFLTLDDYLYYNKWDSDILSLSDGHFVCLSSTACDDWKYGENCNITCQCNTTYAERWAWKKWNREKTMNTKNFRSQFTNNSKWKLAHNYTPKS